ncbi:hypothetical protein AVL50_31870 [Flammeovirga sp. SJP92]|nr:hypothetical protein AVL50_31870 [Flammeovirga sp. SJP92]
MNSDLHPLYIVHHPITHFLFSRNKAVLEFFEKKKIPTLNVESRYSTTVFILMKILSTMAELF